MTNFFKALDLVDEVSPKKIEYRLYYDPKTNLPIAYSMEDLPGDYITITKDEYAAGRFDIIVKDGKIKKIKNIPIGKLVPSTSGYGTLKNDISIVGNEAFWKVKTYE